MSKKRIMKEFRLDEISAVDAPAQKPAIVTIMKRMDKEDDEDEDKEDEDQTDFDPSNLKTRKAETGVPDSTDVSISSGDPADTVGADLEQNMSNQNDQTADLEAVNKQVEELTKRAERAEQVSELSDAQRGIFKGLEGEAADAFLSLTPEQRNAEVAKAAEADAVVFKSLSGEEFRKSDDPRLVEMAKRDDAKTEQLAKMQESADRTLLEKRAEELTHIPGDVDVRVNLLKAIDTLPEGDREGAMQALRAQNESLGKSFQREGTSAVPSSDNSDPLGEIAKRLRTENPELTPEQAVAKALSTPEGEAAYVASLGR